MEDWSNGYLTQISYTNNFYSFLSPVVQNFSLLINGFSPKLIIDKFTYYDLGCGRGLSTLILAAANPSSKFYGIDFNPSQIAAAQQLARYYDISNVEFVEKSFEDITALSLPKADFISLHGVWSWIIPQNRFQIIQFIKNNLSNNGVLFVSYNSLPGSGEKEAIGRLFRENYKNNRDVDGVIEDTKIFMNKMKETDCKYFDVYSDARELLQNLDLLPVNYIAHEYLNSNWNAFYHTDVCEELSKAKLSFACSMDMISSIDELCVGNEASRLLNTIKSRDTREVFRDFYLNKSFRRDLYVRGLRKLSEEERRDALFNTSLLLMKNIPNLPYEINVPAGIFSMEGPIYLGIMHKLQNKTKTIGEIIRHSDLVEFGEQKIFEAIILLITFGFLVPVSKLLEEEEHLVSSKLFNTKVIFGKGLYDIRAMASPIIGNGVQVSKIEQIFMLFIQKTNISLLQDALLLKWDPSAEFMHQVLKMGIELKELNNIEEIWDAFKKEKLVIYWHLGFLRE